MYPEKDTNVTVRLGNSEKLTTTYPKYKDCWNVFAKANGELIDLESNRSYYGLYWEGVNNNLLKVKDEGFVVKGIDSADFLEKSLKILGLNEREANEFIIYWLPKLEDIVKIIIFILKL